MGLRVNNKYTFQHFSVSIMTGILGLLILLLPLAAPLIAQDAIVDKFDPVTNFCYKYNGNCSDPENCSSNTEIENCSEYKDMAYPICFVSWQNSSTSGVFDMKKGCMFRDVNCDRGGKCISKQSKNVKALYCCCHGNYCNDIFSWQPTEPETTKRPTTTNSVSTTHFNTKPNVYITVAFTLSSLVFIFIIVIGLFYYYRKQKFSNFTEITTGESSSLILSHAFSTNFCAKSVKLQEMKAHGRFGAVWRASYPGGEVAVKIFPAQDVQSFMSEKHIYTLPQMRHENVLQFYGVEQYGNSITAEYWLLTAYHEKGSLFEYLKANTVTWFELCRICESLCAGLAYLHGEQPANADKSEALKPAIAHRDFKSKNILLKNDLTCCVADFGLAIAFYPRQIPAEQHGQVGTRRYMAPEVLEGAVTFQRDSFLPIDMYACALVIWEVASRCSVGDIVADEYRQPFEREVGTLPSLDEMQQCVVTRRMRPQIPTSWWHQPGMREIADTIKDSWDHDAEARLSAFCVVERIAACKHIILPSKAPVLLKTPMTEVRFVSPHAV